MKSYDKGIDTPMSSVSNGATGRTTQPYIDSNYQNNTMSPVSDTNYQNNTISPVTAYQSLPAPTYAAPQQKSDPWNSAPRYEAPMETAPQELDSASHR